MCLLQLTSGWLAVTSKALVEISKKGKSWSSYEGRKCIHPSKTLTTYQHNPPNLDDFLLSNITHLDMKAHATLPIDFPSTPDAPSMRSSQLFGHFQKQLQFQVKINFS